MLSHNPAGASSNIQLSETSKWNQFRAMLLKKGNIIEAGIRIKKRGDNNSPDYASFLKGHGTWFQVPTLSRKIVKEVFSHAMWVSFQAITWLGFATCSKRHAGEECVKALSNLVKPKARKQGPNMKPVFRYCPTDPGDRQLAKELYNFKEEKDFHGYKCPHDGCTEMSVTKAIDLIATAFQDMGRKIIDGILKLIPKSVKYFLKTSFGQRMMVKKVGFTFPELVKNAANFLDNFPKECGHLGGGLTWRAYVGRLKPKILQYWDVKKQDYKTRLNLEKSNYDPNLVAWNVKTNSYNETILAAKNFTLDRRRRHEAKFDEKDYFATVRPKIKFFKLGDEERHKYITDFADGESLASHVVFCFIHMLITTIVSTYFTLFSLLPLSQRQQYHICSRVATLF